MEDTLRSSRDWRLFFRLTASVPNFRSNLKWADLSKMSVLSIFHLSKYLGSPSETASLSASAGVKRWRPRHQNTEDIIFLVAKFYCLGLSFAKRHGHVLHWLAKRWPHQISPTFPQSPSWEKRSHISLGSPLASERQSARRHLPSLTGLVYGRAQPWKPSRTFPLVPKSTARKMSRTPSCGHEDWSEYNRLVEKYRIKLWNPLQKNNPSLQELFQIVHFA